MYNLQPYMNYPVSQERLMQDLQTLCQWERLSGTPEEQKAFHFIEKQMQDAGAETQLLFHDAYISLPISGKLVVAGKEYHCHTASMAKSTPPEGVRGTLVYLDGEAQTLTAETCRNKVVLLGGNASFEKIHKAWKEGATAVIGCTGEHIHEKIISNAWGSPTPFTRDLIPDVPYLSITEEVRDQLLALIGNGLVEAHVTTVVDTGWRKIPLLFATVNALTPTDDYVMFSGHLDSWYYGATDNGTANCIQLECARIAAQHRKELKRNVKFVYYSGHSHGRYAGSAWHADNYWMDLHQHCVININCDIIGGVGATDLTRSIIMPEARQLAAEIVKAYTGIDFHGSRCGRNGDQSYYITGVSSAFSSFSKQPHPEKPEDKLSQTRSGAFDFGWWWHNEADLIDKVDPDFFLRDARIFITFTLYCAIADEIPFDFHASAVELSQLVEYWIDRARGRFDLSDVLELSRALVAETEKVYGQPHADLERFNALQMTLGRILVPLNYTTGNLYENDNGIPKPPMPALAMINNLVKTPVGSSESFDILTELTHKKNFVYHSFFRALELLRSYQTA